MKIRKIIMIVLVSTFYSLLYTQLSFAPVGDDVGPEEAIRAIEIQREAAREAQRAKEEQIQEAQKLDTQKTETVIPRVASTKKSQTNQRIKFWLVTLGVSAVGIFILLSIKTDKKK